MPAYPLREIFSFLLNPILHPQQDRRLPFIQLAQLIELEEFIGKGFLVALFNGLGQIDEELVLPRGGEGLVEISVGFEGAGCGDHVL